MQYIAYLFILVALLFAISVDAVMAAVIIGGIAWCFGGAWFAAGILAAKIMAFLSALVRVLYVIFNL